MTPENVDAMVLKQITEALDTGKERDRYYAAGMIFALGMTGQITTDKAMDYRRTLQWGIYAMAREDTGGGGEA